MHHSWALVAILLVGVFLRWTALAPMEVMLSYDEAYNGVDAVSLLRSPRLTPFLPTNQGRESGWVYVLAPFVAVFGARPFALRLAATMTGVLTVAACYALARELMGRRGAVWAAFALAVLYWHVHTSYLVLRVNLFLLIGALAFAALLRAHRTNAGLAWAAGGLGIGLLGYTYFAAYTWMLFAAALLAWWFLREPDRRPGVLIAVLVAMGAFAPMAAYACLHPAEVLNRAGTVRVATAGAVWQNLGLWLQAWFPPGSANPRSDPLGRPILDPYLGALFLLGLASLPWVLRRRGYGLWLAGWTLAALLPSLLSDQAPHSLRGVGLTLPAALLAGAGALALERVLQRSRCRGAAALVPLIPITLAGIITYRDVYGWLHDPQTQTVMESHLGRAVALVKALAPADEAVYFSPLTPSHPVLAFRRAALAPRPVRAFDSHQCLVIPDGPATYVSLTIYEPDLAEKLGRWVGTEILAQESMEPGTLPLYTVFTSTPLPGGPWRGARQVATYADTLQVGLLDPIPGRVRAGDTISVRLGVRALHPVDRPYSVFVHLYGEPTPYEGGRMWSQGDCQLCPSYPTTLWQTDETIVQ